MVVSTNFAACLLVFCAAGGVAVAAAQTPASPIDSSKPDAPYASNASRSVAPIHLSAGLATMPEATTGQSGSGPVISLNEAIRRAQTSEAAYAVSLAESRATALDRSIARAALLPNAVSHNQFLYTQPNGQKATPGQTGVTQAAPRFIANNTVHEYVVQGSVTETLGLAQLAELRRADAAAARTRAELEIARRGLVGTVAGLYYNVLASAKKVAVAERALSEANGFTDMTQKRETGREVAHADVVKAQLQQQQRQRDVSDARVAAEKARLDLGVLIFPDPRTSYQLEPAGTPVALPERMVAQTAASTNNPELQSAFASLRESDVSILTARAAYLPDLALNYTYGIDAPQLAANGPGGVRNLGYSASVTLDIPIWDWLATEHRVRQSQIRRDAVRVALTAAQRRAIADFEEFYAEAAAAREQSASLEVSVQTAAESLRLTKLRYNEGEATLLEVVDAQNALTSAENSREDGTVRYQTAIANLQTLTGRL